MGRVPDTTESMSTKVNISVDPANFCICPFSLQQYEHIKLSF